MYSSKSKIGGENPSNLTLSSATFSLLSWFNLIYIIYSGPVFKPYASKQDCILADRYYRDRFEDLNELKSSRIDQPYAQK